MRNNAAEILSKRITALFCVMAALLCISAVMLSRVCTASAADGQGKLAVWCVRDDDIVSEMHWQIYRVGYRTDRDYVFEGDFKDYRPTLGDRTKPMLEWDAETVADAGETLKRIIIADKVPSIAEGVTDSKGCVTFSGLADGLYLVCGDILRKENTIYIPSAIFLEMNGDDAAVLNAYPKIVLRTMSSETVSYSVRKVWQNDEDQPQKRSTAITVERYCDNELYDEFVLSDENDWTYKWTDSEGHQWFVHEKAVPEDYTVVYKDNTTQFLIINTYEGDKQTVTTTTTVTTAGGTVSTETSRTQTTVSSTAKTVTTTGGKIPQTGQLWWPVLPLACGGVLMTGLGLRLRRKDSDEDEE